MKISEAILRADKMLNNHYDEETKIQWLAELDERVMTDVFETHEKLCELIDLRKIISLRNEFKPLYEAVGADVSQVDYISGDVTAPWVLYLRSTFKPVYDETDMPLPELENKSPAEMELLIPSSYNDIYIFYLLYKYAFHNGEFDRASYYASEYSGLYTQYLNWVNRTYMPISTAKIREGLPWQ